MRALANHWLFFPTCQGSSSDFSKLAKWTKRAQCGWAWDRGLTHVTWAQSA